MDKLPKSNFTANLLALNHPVLSDFREWLFRPGMGYGDSQTWWNKDKARPTDHEGLDFAAYLDLENRPQKIGEGIIVPPLFQGRIVKMVNDFLGKTIVIDHNIADNNGHLLHTFHAHLVPAVSFETGGPIAAEKGIGVIAPGIGKCPAHLHISTAWVAPGYSFGEYDWTDFSKRADFRPCDPIEFLRIPGR